jgi:hypothetical protein
LNIFAGIDQDQGKSLVMMNIALSRPKRINGIYITLELSEELTSLRTDAMLTMTGKAIRKDIDTTELRVKMTGRIW